MELIHIGEGKLKVMLTEEDMALYALDTALSDGGGAEARRVVRDILDAAGAPLGFAAAQDKICIQIFRGRGGGCELFVSCAETGGTRRLSTPLRRSPTLRGSAASSPRRASPARPPRTSATTAGCFSH